MRIGHHGARSLEANRDCDLGFALASLTVMISGLFVALGFLFAGLWGFALGVVAQRNSPAETADFSTESWQLGISILGGATFICAAGYVLTYAIWK